MQLIVSTRLATLSITLAASAVAAWIVPTCWAISLVAFAVCAPAPAGYEVAFAPSPEKLSETVKTARATCSGTRRLIGAGGAITNVAPGTVSFERVYPVTTNQVEARAVENTPTTPNWNFIVAAKICATAV